MTTLSTYLDKLPAFNRDKPNFVAVLTTLLQPLVDERDSIEALIAKYDVEAAEGAQLDVIGQWVGFGRRVRIPLEGVYFSLDIEGLGLDQGVWLGPEDPETVLAELPDDVYRAVLLAKIAANYWDGTREELQAICTQFFQTASPTARVFVIDNFDMTMTVGIAGAIPGTVFMRIFLDLHVPMPPAAVGSNLIVTTEDGTPIFGFDIENDYVSGFDSGAWSAPVM